MNRVHEILIGNLKLHRRRLGLTQEQLAERCDLTPKYITSLEIGRRFPSSETILQLAQALGIKPYQLFLEGDDVEAFDREELLLRYSEELKEGFAGMIDARLREKLRRKKR
jgi:transcriptional regulator with XRE-family HTH domain